jgi:sugar-specific transcriptional regulator TrmB
MSERYGAPGEPEELLGDLEDWLNRELKKARAELTERETVNSHDPRYNAGRIETIREVLEFIIVNPGG